jgi:N-acetylneuraminic acid mutarotase
MNKFLFITVFLMLNSGKSIYSQSTWVTASGFTGGTRDIAFYFTANGNGYMGGGRSGQSFYNDLWAYEPISDSWSQKASLPSNSLIMPGTFTIGDTAYIVSGWNTQSGPSSNEVWSYIASSNTWFQKNNFPGPARYSSIGFSLNGYGYVGTGYAPYLSDIWKYNPGTDSWSQQPNFPGGARLHSTSITINNKAYVGLGYNNGNSYNDWWEFNPSVGANGSWTQKAPFTGGGRRGAVAFISNGLIYVGTGYNDISYYNDLWEFNPATNSWVQKAFLAAPPRYGGIGWSLNNCGYIGTGSNGLITSPLQFGDLNKYCNTVSIQDMNSLNTIEVKWNDYDKILEIKNTTDKVKSIALYTIEGKIIYNSDINSCCDFKITLPGEFKSGICLYRVVTINNIYAGKLLISN